MYHFSVLCILSSSLLINHIQPFMNRVMEHSLGVMAAIVFCGWLIETEINAHRKIKKKLIRIETTQLEGTHCTTGKIIHIFDEKNQVYENYTDLIVRMNDGKEKMFSCVREDVIKKIETAGAAKEMTLYHVEGIILEAEEKNQAWINA